MTRARRTLKGAAALILLAGLLFGVPAALWRYVGWPLPHNIPSWSQLRNGLTNQGIPDNLLIKTLAVVVWLTWGTVLASVWAESVAAARGRVARRLPGLAPVQSFAGHLVAAVVLAVAPMSRTSGPHHTPTLAVALQPMNARAGPPSPVRVGPATAVDTARAVARASPASTPAAAAYVVQRRDTLWGIAQAHLGDPLRWPEIFRLNQGRPQADGSSLTNPNLIRPGWRLELPSSSASLPSEASVAQSAPTAAPQSAPPPTKTDIGRQASAPPDVACSPTPVTSPSSVPAPPAQPPPAPPHQRGREHGIRLPTGSVVGLSLAAAISAALATARLRRRASYQPSPPKPGLSPVEPFANEAVRRLRRAVVAGDSHDDANAKVSVSVAPPAGVLAVGESENGDLVIDVLAGAIDFGGSGAADVLRALLVGALVGRRPDQVTALIAGNDIALQLLGFVHSKGSIDVVADLAGALARLEVEVIRRTRLLAESDAPDYRTYADAHPEDALPVLLAVHGGPEPATQHRLDAIQAVAGRLGIALLGLERDVRDRRLVIDNNSIVTEEVAFDGWRGVDLYRLTRHDTTDLLGAMFTLEEAPLRSTGTPPTFVLPSQPGSAAIEIAVLGPEHVVVGGEEVRTGVRAKARELLAFLAAHPAGATWEAAADALWPEADAQRGNDRFRTVLGNVRTLRERLEGADLALVERVADRYRLNPEVVSCDLWRFEGALDRTMRASDGAVVGSALQLAADLYRGDFCEGSYYEWAEPIREDLRRRVLDVLVRMAQLQETSGDANGAVATLERAIDLDPYAESIHMAVIKLYGRLGRPDAARRTYARLERHLGQIDTDPQQETLDALNGALDRGQRRLRSVPEDEPSRGQA